MRSQHDPVRPGPARLTVAKPRLRSAARQAHDPARYCGRQRRHRGPGAARQQAPSSESQSRAPHAPGRSMPALSAARPVTSGGREPQAAGPLPRPRVPWLDVPRTYEACPRPRPTPSNVWLTASTKTARSSCPRTTRKNNSAPSPVRVRRFGIRTFLGVPVIHEESIKACPEWSRRVAGATKATDYTFRIGGRRVDIRPARSIL